jgi:hypothetical protein
MEQLKNNQENPEAKLKDFREEIGLIIEEERANQKTAHFNELKPEELSPEDLEVWEKIKDGSVTQENMKEYKNIFFDGEGKIKENITPGRKEFMAFANNKANIVLLNKQIKQMRSK